MMWADFLSHFQDDNEGAVDEGEVGGGLDESETTLSKQIGSSQSPVKNIGHGEMPHTPNQQMDSDLCQNKLKRAKTTIQPKIDTDDGGSGGTSKVHEDMEESKVTNMRDSHLIGGRYEDNVMGKNVRGNIDDDGDASNLLRDLGK